MKFPTIRVSASLVLLALMLVSLWWASGYYGRLSQLEASPDRHFHLSDRLSTLETVDTPGGLRFRFEENGREHLQTPDEFAREIERNQERRTEGGWFFRVFDITSATGIFWVTLGLLGQLAFTGRMVVQWLVSEKRKQSVVPNLFWWMSLFGSSLLVVYFLWRVDIVGVLGQATGWFIYIRNLWLIYRRDGEYGL